MITPEICGKIEALLDKASALLSPNTPTKKDWA
jgi:hypothetical protein